MKIRADFVTNSSSSSYVFWGFYSKELVEYLKELIEKGLVYGYNERYDSLSDKDGYAANSLHFFPYYYRKVKEKTGFQIEEVECGHSHSTPLDALLAYIDVSMLPEDEATAIIEKTTELVKKALDDNQILWDCAKGMTDDLNAHFNEDDIHKSFFEIYGNTVISCFNKKIKNIGCDSWKGIGKIGQSAFEGMTELETVSVECKYMKEIGANSFAGCTKLKTFRNSSQVIKNFDIPEDYPDFSFISCDTINENAFKNCKSLHSIIFNGTNKIRPHAFEGCESLEAIGFDAETRYIEDFAFSGCINLKDVYLTDESVLRKGLTKISPTAFSDCNNVVFHVREGTYAHKFAVKNKIEHTVIKRLPQNYRVDNMRTRENDIAEKLNIGDKVYLKKYDGDKDILSFEVFNAEGDKLGSISEYLKITQKYIVDNFENIEAVVKSFISLQEVRAEKPKAYAPYLYITLKLKEQ